MNTKIIKDNLDILTEARNGDTDFAEDILRHILESQPDGSIDLSDMDDPTVVTYDGGRHPKYASNAFSIVNNIHIDDNGTIRIDCEDCKDYELSRVTSTDERRDLLRAVLSVIEEEDDGIPDLFLLRTISEEIGIRMRTLKEKSRDIVADILSGLPERRIASHEYLGYLNYETLGDTWIEAGIGAMRITENGVIELACDADEDDDGRPVINDWDDADRERTFSEHDRYMTVNWPMTLQMLTGHLENHPELMLKPGDRVRWNDPAINDYEPEDRQAVLDRIFTVDEIRDDMVRISEDDSTQAEVPAKELKKI